MRDLPAIRARSAVVIVSIVAVVLAGVVVGPVWSHGSASTPEHAQVESVTGNTTVAVAYTSASGDSTSAVVDGVDPGLSNAADGWAIVERSSLPPALQAVSQTPGSGVVGFGEWALVGANTNATVSIGQTTLTVVVPAGRDVDPSRKAGFLRQFLDPYVLDSETPERVVLVAAPDELAHEGAMYGDDRGYVTIEEFWDGDVGSVWIHEYIHARQNFQLGPEMAWFREASAEYLSYRVLEEQYDEVTESDIRERLTAFRDHEGVVLGNRTTWRETSADYHVGARLLASIDAEIRNDTDGKYTLFDVFRAMNDQNGPITVDTLVRLIEQRTGTDQSWIKAAIRSGSMPET